MAPTQNHAHANNPRALKDSDMSTLKRLTIFLRKTQNYALIVHNERMNNHVALWLLMMEIFTQQRENAPCEHTHGAGTCWWLAQRISLSVLLWIA